MDSKFRVVWPEPLTRFCQQVFEKLGVPEKDAHTTSRALVLADLRGIESHGVARLRRYYIGLKTGVMVSQPKIKVVHETPISALICGGGGLGQVAGEKGMALAIEKSLKNGFGFVAVKNSNHFGIAANYALMALKHDLIGISMTNSAAYVVPTFGRAIMLGTNPISVAVPALKEKPYVLDMSTAATTLGKLEVYARKGEKINKGWAVDETGCSCDDPARVLNNIKTKIGGGLRPLGGEGEALGGHKGYGLDLMVDIFSGVLSGSANTNLLYTKTADGKPLPSLVGHFFGAMRVDFFRPLDDFKRDMDDMIIRIRNSPKAEGCDRIYIPGEKEFEREDKYRKEGIPLYCKVYDDLKAIGDEVGIAFDL